MESSSAREEETEPPGPEQAPPRDESDDSIWERVATVSTIAPVQGDPSLEPADNPWELAMMAGWGDPNEDGRGHDALQGVDALVLGEVDANDEIRVEGPGLSLEDEITLDERVGRELAEHETHDWTSHL